MFSHADDHRLRNDLRAINGDGIAFSLMVGVGETYLPAFALAVGLGEVVAGLVSAVPLLAGAVLQLATPAAVRRLGSHKRWVLCCAALQAASFAPLVAAALIGRVSALALLAVVTVYWAAGLGTGPAWNRWVSAIVPPEIRPRFFATRSRLAQASVLLGVVAGGAALQQASGHDAVLLVFAVLFLAAALSRVVSLGFLIGQSEPPIPDTMEAVSIRDLMRRARRGADVRLLTYLLLVQGGVYIAAPFFTPYMLGKLQFSYAQYLVLLAASFAAKMLTLPLIGSLIERIGTHRLLCAAGIGIVPTASLWIVSDSFWYLLAIQVLAGAIWAGWELATFLLIFEHIDERERTSVLTMFNLGNAVATVGGAVIGAALLYGLGVSVGAYLVLFGASSAARLLSLPWLFALGRAPGKHVMISPRPLAARPGTGSVDTPIVASLDEPF